MVLRAADELYQDERDGWTLKSVDGSRGAHSEHTIAVTDDGPIVLTRQQWISSGRLCGTLAVKSKHSPGMESVWISLGVYFRQHAGSFVRSLFGYYGACYRRNIVLYVADYELYPGLGGEARLHHYDHPGGRPGFPCAVKSPDWRKGSGSRPVG